MKEPNRTRVMVVGGCVGGGGGGVGGGWWWGGGGGGLCVLVGGVGGWVGGWGFTCLCGSTAQPRDGGSDERLDDPPQTSLTAELPHTCGSSPRNPKRPFDSVNGPASPSASDGGTLGHKCPSKRRLPKRPSSPSPLGRPVSEDPFVTGS